MVGANAAAVHGRAILGILVCHFRATRAAQHSVNAVIVISLVLRAAERSDIDRQGHQISTALPRKCQIPMKMKVVDKAKKDDKRAGMQGIAAGWRELCVSLWKSEVSTGLVLY